MTGFLQPCSGCSKSFGPFVFCLPSFLIEASESLAFFARNGKRSPQRILIMNRTNLNYEGTKLIQDPPKAEECTLSTTGFLQPGSGWSIRLCFEEVNSLKLLKVLHFYLEMGTDLHRGSLA